MVEVGIRTRFLQGEEDHTHTLKEVLDVLGRLEKSLQRVEDKIGNGLTQQLAVTKSTTLGEVLSSDTGGENSVPTTNREMSVKNSFKKSGHRPLRWGGVDGSKENTTSHHKVLWHNAGTALMLDSAFAHKIGFEWPRTVRLREGLQQGRSTSSLFGGGAGIAEPDLLFEMTKGDVFKRRRFMPSVPLNPDSFVVFLVDWVRFFVLLYEIFLTPVLIAWGVESDPTITIMQRINGCYWIFDCLLNFVTGFYRDSVLVMDWRTIAVHYMQSWFAPDLFLLCVDWVVIVVDAVGGTGNNRSDMRTVLTVARALRGVKILRLGKVVLLVNTIAAGLMSRESAMRAQLIKIPFALIIYNHIVCCAWAFIARLEREGTYRVDVSWLDQLDSDVDTVLSQYLVCLHFTFAQMTPGPINLTAVTSLERALNCMLLVCGLLYGSIIISQFSGHVMQITVLQRGKMQKMDAVRLFLKQREVTRSLAGRIQKQVRLRIYEETPLQFAQVQAFEHLAEPLKKELLTELRLSPLCSHMLFRIWHGMEPTEVEKVCHESLESVVLLQQDQLFVAGMESHQAYLLMKRGSLKYIQEPLYSMVEERMVHMVHKDTWFCEAALWAYWVHVGCMEAEDASEMLVIHSDSLIRVLSSDAPGARMMQHYAKGYHLRITSAQPPFAPWPTDLSVPYTTLGDLVGSGVGISLLNAAVESGRIALSNDAQETLVDEIAAGKCTLSTSLDGNLERLVAVVACKVTNRDERILMHVGKFEGKTVKAVCSLPAVKRGASELQEACFERLLGDRLPGLLSHLTVAATETSILRMDSTSYGIPTMYQRTTTSSIYEGELATDCEDWTRTAVRRDNVLHVDALYHVSIEGRFNVFAWVVPSILDSFEGSSTEIETQKAMVTAWLSNLDLTGSELPPPTGLELAEDEISIDVIHEEESPKEPWDAAGIINV
mmetsp:Transcript_49184/g.115027  ORF Transcript_49184/g.115027 Transcript_49184/m.115027 type:complete len:941 (-) Transcript_49184:148-2970(-)